MKLKSRLLAVGSALAMVAVATSANAADVLIEGTGLWGVGTTETAYSGSGKSFQFSFSLPNPLDSNPTSQISNFSYSLAGMAVSAIPLSIEFFNLGDSGMFDFNFADATVSLFGDDIGSTGLFTTPASYSFTSSISGISGGGNGFLTVTSAVPEPATWAMMIAGFGALGMAMRRRRRVTTTVSYAI